MQAAVLAHFVLDFCVRDDFDTHDGQFVPVPRMCLTLSVWIHSVLDSGNTA